MYIENKIKYSNDNKQIFQKLYKISIYTTLITFEICYTSHEKIRLSKNYTSPSQ